jgi:hypothetical protein
MVVDALNSLKISKIRRNRDTVRLAGAVIRLSAGSVENSLIAAGNAAMAGVRRLWEARTR